jgi:hypothetical protein
MKVKSVRVLSTTRSIIEKHLLPESFTPIQSYCLLFGGEKNSLCITPEMFCGEKEMSRLLMLKSMTGGRNTPHFGIADCVLGSMPNHSSGDVPTTATIAELTRTMCCGFETTELDRHHTLMTRELVCRAFDSPIDIASAGLVLPAGVA